MYTFILFIIENLSRKCFRLNYILVSSNLALLNSSFQLNAGFTAFVYTGLPYN